MPDSNGNRTTNEWLRHIDESNTEAHNRILDKLDKKSDKGDVDKLEKRVGEVEKKTGRLAVKQAGIAGAMSALALGIKGFFFGA